MKLFKIVALTVTTLILGTGMLFAQVQQQPQMPDLPTSSDVSDDEINQLVSTINELEPIQIQTEEKIGGVLEEEGLSMERFQQMMMAMQNPQMADQLDITDEEMGIVQKIQPTLMEIQGEAEQQMNEKIEENGLTMDRYRMIVMGAQQDPELMERLQTELENE